MVETGFMKKFFIRFLSTTWLLSFDYEEED